MARVGSSPTAVIAGGGLAGISAAMHLRVPYLLLERDGRLGGLATTREKQGFRFDHTGHWLHLRDPDIRALVTGLMGDRLVEVARIARIYSHGVLTRYPFQGNLHGLPPEVIKECLVGLFRARLAQQRGAPEPTNFEEFILHHFGEGIARHFMVPYNAKLWGVPPRELTSAWCSRFVPRPDVEQIIAGAVGAGPAELGYNVRFLYPREGGIGAVSAALAGTLDPARVRLGTAVARVDERRREVTTAAGEVIPYTHLITSLPLPALVRALAWAPPEVREAAGRLRATRVNFLDVAARRPAPVDYHWVYVPEARLPFYRVGIFSNAVASMAPPGCASYYVELAGRSLGDDREAVVREALAGLVELGALGSVDDVIFADLRTIDPAYVIFDEAYQPALDVIFPYLERCGILSCGRYGAWIYNAMEDSLLAGRAAAERVNAEAAGAAGAEGGS